ncbi:MAG TPA: type II toxin-antitoxin system prevent-host-death family antitoxin [Acidimicrobiales bacterium]|nr:type II toxin-antitoxin system prevent-host-death family antitoxin [Acidimicrobiales bacterium]
MQSIAQRELRNASAAILRRAEAGERFVITVDGRPVAVLGPYDKRQWVPQSAVREVLSTPTDSSQMDEFATFDGPLDDPWERS